MSTALARALEDEVLQLYERAPDKHTALEKQRLYSRVGQFLLTALDQQQARHWWCRFPTLMTFMMRVLELHPGPDSVRLFFERMAQQLALCTKCVDIYHSALPSVRMELEEEFTQASVKEFLHKLASF
ncbi:hypothetical protein ATCC90586_001998 [Pythium insidiosum]|nr:hypothetical protein ATCC90586_001998 [Pythium insidiosum]